MSDLPDAVRSVCRDGLEEEGGPVFSADATAGAMVFTDGPYVESKEFLGGLTIVDVPAEACGWPQEVRRFKPRRVLQG